VNESTKRAQDALSLLNMNGCALDDSDDLALLVNLFSPLEAEIASLRRDLDAARSRGDEWNAAWHERNKDALAAEAEAKRWEDFGRVQDEKAHKFIEQRDGARKALAELNSALYDRVDEFADDKKTPLECVEDCINTLRVNLTKTRVLLWDTQDALRNLIKTLPTCEEGYYSHWDAGSEKTEEAIVRAHSILDKTL
jgi:chromosome segregation ATPase